MTSLNSDVYVCVCCSTCVAILGYHLPHVGILYCNLPGDFPVVSMTICRCISHTYIVHVLLGVLW